MQNVFSQGSEYSHIEQHYPINEDWCFVATVQNQENFIVTATKVWDESLGVTTYSAININRVPLFQGQQVILHRVGEYASTGDAGFELRDEDPTRASWVCFPLTPVVTVKDLSGIEDPKGQEVVFDGNGNFSTPPGSDILPLVARDKNYHEDQPPYRQGRIYAAVKEPGNPPRYSVWLPGYGCTAKVFYDFPNLHVLEVDGAGKVVHFGGWPFWQWDDATRDWSAINSVGMPPNRYWHAMAEIGGNIYISGGLGLGGCPAGDHWKYTVSTNTWSQLNDPVAPLAGANKRHGHTYFNGGTPSGLYGGRDTTGQITKSVFEYLFATDQWKAGTPNRNTEFAIACDTINMVANPAYPGIVEIYSGSGGTWSDSLLTLVFGSVAPTFKTAGGEIVATGGGHFAIAGGYLADGTVTDQCAEWIQPSGLYFQSTTMPAKRADWDATNIIVSGSPDYMLFFGGVDDVGDLKNNTYSYDTSGVWTDLAPTNAPSPRRGHRIVHIGNKAYLFGGIET